MMCWRRSENSWRKSHLIPIWLLFCGLMGVRYQGPANSPWERAIEIGQGTSLVVQWLRIHLPMQGIQVPSLVQEDPTCSTTREATAMRSLHTTRKTAWVMRTQHSQKQIERKNKEDYFRVCKARLKKNVFALCPILQGLTCYSLWPTVVVCASDRGSGENRVLCALDKQAPR